MTLTQALRIQVELLLKSKEFVNFEINQEPISETLKALGMAPWYAAPLLMFNYTLSQTVSDSPMRLLSGAILCYCFYHTHSRNTIKTSKVSPGQ
jgi:hypothetical protein